MIFTPSSNLDYDTQYGAYLYSDAMDLAYNSLVRDGWNFRTMPPNNPPYTPRTPSGSAHGYAGRSYSYSIFAKDPDDGDQLRYTLDWGDGTASETEFVDSGRSVSQSHVWDDEGGYSVRVMAADSEGDESDWSPPLVVAISRRPHPTAVISANPAVITEGETISFGAEGSKSYYQDGGIVSYEWDFGDGSTGAGANVEHTYPRSGQYTVTLTVTCYENLSATDSMSITVEPAPVLSISISTGSVPSGESGEVLVWVTSNDGLTQGASVHLSATTGKLNPNEGLTDRYGEFASIFTVPIVDATERYTIYAKAEVDGMRGEGSESDLIMVGPDMPPTAHIEIHQDPAEEGGSITIEGWGKDEDGDVLGCRWTFPDGTTIRDFGDSSELTLTPDEVQAGVYSFAVMDDRGRWSKAAEFELPMPPQGGEEITHLQTNFSRVLEYISEHISDPAVLAAMVVALAAGALWILKPPPPPKPNSDPKIPEEDEAKDKHGSILATSDPSNAAVVVDVEYKGRSPITIDNVLIGTHTVLFLKRGYLGYEKNAIVVANQTTPVHRDLTKMPEVKLKLSADPVEIAADRESRSTIEIEIVTKDDNEIPIPVPEDTTVILEADIGMIESPVKIHLGHASTRSTLRSAGSSGTATVKAEAKCGMIAKPEGSTTVEFPDAESE
uniref:PKD domain-containing protein n=1 Tax=Candidatus Methanogaster sp. ANME-2c ERB4 TaxID=2759911 RepID=A0A7G9YNQ0_9EURY|nr:hypothetical protein AIHMFPNM_00037 [Methanosarcinales archaeon ANME-2c ERB4]